MHLSSFSKNGLFAAEPVGRGDGDGIENGTFLLSLETRNSLLTAFRLALLFLPPRYFMEASLPPSALIPSLLLQRLKLGVGGEDRRGNWAAEERGDFEHLSARPSVFQGRLGPASGLLFQVAGAV